MSELIDISDVSGWGAFGSLALLLMTLVLTGRLVPRRTHKDVIEERNTWRATSEAKDDTISELISQQRELRIGVRAQTSILHSLPRVSDEATD